MKSSSQTPGDTHCYLAVSQQDIRWGLYATGAGYAQNPPHKAYPAEGHPKGYGFTWEKGRTLQDYALVYLTYGKGEFENRHGSTRPLAAGDLMILQPGEWHRYRPDPVTGWHEYWVGFNGRIAKDLFAETFFSPDEPVLNVGYNEYLTRLFVETLELAREMPPAFQQRIAAHILHILALVRASQKKGVPGNTGDEELIRRIRCALTERIEQNIPMEKLAKELHVGYARFRHVFKHHTGLSPGQYHLQLRISRAKEALTATTLPVKQIALQLGFDSPFYFSRIFKNKTGLSPQEWRNLTAPENRRKTS